MACTGQLTKLQLDGIWQLGIDGLEFDARIQVQAKAVLAENLQLQSFADLTATLTFDSSVTKLKQFIIYTAVYIWLLIGCK